MTLFMIALFMFSVVGITILVLECTDLRRKHKARKLKEESSDR